MKVKAVEKLLKFDKNSAGVYRYVMSPEMYSSLITSRRTICTHRIPDGHHHDQLCRLRTNHFLK